MSDPTPPISEHPTPLSDERKLALFQAVFDEIPDVIVLKDEKGDFLLCNQTVARLYGTTPELMVGKHDDDFGVPKAVADGFRDNVLDIMAHGQTEAVFEDSHDATTGEVRHFKSIKRPFKDAQGRNQILVIAHDITDVVRAQAQVVASERRLREVMAATQEGVWDWHLPTGHVVHNERWFGLMGFSEGEIADHVDAFSAHLHPDDRPLVWERIQRLLNGSVDLYDSEHRMICKDGSFIWVHDRGRITERDAQQHPVRVVGAFADITERKRNLAALEHTLNMAQSATRAKSDFLATMSHELRTPLNGVLGMAQLLQMPDVTDAERVDYARTIVSSGKTLLALLNDILDLSKVEAGHMALEHLSYQPCTLVRDTLKTFEAQAQRKGIALEADLSGLTASAYLGDPLRLRQMLSNYVGNAIKFTRQGSVRVRLSELRDGHQPPMLEFSVADSGIGIAPDKQAQLFNPFTQADNTTTREFGGTGLGLSIVARFAELMGGAVGLHSQVGQGSRFWFRVPAQTPAENGTKSPTTPAAPTAALTPQSRVPPKQLSGHVLVAEDNPVNRMVIRALLDNLGLSVTFAEDGQEAVNAVMQGNTSPLILMDIQMPNVGGLEATRQIRQWEATQGSPRRVILALTAGAFDDERQKCMDAGMDDFLTKPIELAKLSEALTRWLP